MKNIVQAAKNAAQKSQAAHQATVTNRKVVTLPNLVGKFKTVKLSADKILNFQNCEVHPLLCGEDYTTVEITARNPQIEVECGNKLRKWINV